VLGEPVDGVLVVQGVALDHQHEQPSHPETEELKRCGRIRHLSALPSPLRKIAYVRQYNRKQYEQVGHADAVHAHSRLARLSNEGLKLRSFSGVDAQAEVARTNNLKIYYKNQK